MAYVVKDIEHSRHGSEHAIRVALCGVVDRHRAGADGCADRKQYAPKSEPRRTDAQQHIDRKDVLVHSARFQCQRAHCTHYFESLSDEGGRAVSEKENL